MNATTGKRPRHRKKDFEKLLREAERRGWRIRRRKGYFRIRCPEPCKCSPCVVLTPSSSRTLLNTRKAFERCTGWNKED